MQLAKAVTACIEVGDLAKSPTVDTLLCRFIIDFAGKSGHSMDWPLRPNPSNPSQATTFWRGKLRTWMACAKWQRSTILDLIKIVLQSYGGKATIDQIQQVLVPDVIADDWKKWWEVAKRELKKDGHFQVPLKKSEPIVYQVQEVSLQDRLLGEFRAQRS